MQYLFQANPVNMIGRYPRYRELWERYRATCDRPEGAEAYFVTRDYADLQVLSQLAWFDEYFLDEPEVAALIQKGEDFSRDDQQLVIAKEREILSKVLPAYAEAAQRGSIELSATPYYHPILPLLCDTNVGRAVHARAALCRRGTSGVPKMPVSRSSARWILTRRCSGFVPRDCGLRKGASRKRR